MKEIIIRFFVVLGFLLGTIANLGMISNLLQSVRCSFLNGDVGGGIFLIVILICTMSYGITSKAIIDKFW